MPIRPAHASVSIRSRLLLLVLSVLVPAALAALVTITRAYENEQHVIERYLHDTTRALSMVVDVELKRRATIAEALAQSSSLTGTGQITSEELTRFDARARRISLRIDGWVELRAAEGTLLSTRHGGAAPAVPGQPAPVRPLFRVPTIGPLESAGAGGAGQVPSAAIVEPVLHDGQTLLNVVVTVLPGELQQIIDLQNLPGDTVAGVLDNRHTVVARHPGGSAAVGRAAAPELKQQLSMGAEGFIDAMVLDGVVYAGYYRTSPQGWTYFSALPRSQVADRAQEAALGVGLGAMLLLAVAVAGALWVARSIVKPVCSLKDAAERMQGGLPVERTPTGIKECDDVNDAMADAADVLRDARADLERQVEQAVARTRDAEQRVAQSQRIEALGRLTGGVAHDFNNLLGVVSNSAHLIERQAANDALKAPLAAMMRAVSAGSRLTQHLLRFAGRQPVRPRTVQLLHFLPELQELMKTVLGARIQMSVEVAPDTHRVTVDASELELALLNLALNARDAMASTGGKVRVQARNAGTEEVAGLSEGRFVVITVSDNGSGIDEESAARAFEPFFTTKAVGKGTGLGLSQVHGFCVQAGGTARLDSTPGYGTAVSLILPAGADDANEPAPAPRPAGGAGISGKHVLVVEDNDELGDVTVALLESYGCHVQRARTPQHALPLFDGPQTFDVVISDVVMPGGMDGVELASTLRKRFPALPIVLISGYSTAIARARDFPVLNKPCTPEDLVAALERAIEDGGGSTA
jgi:signal transduction histidine kinase